MAITIDVVLQTAIIGVCLAFVLLLINRLRSSQEEKNVQKKSTSTVVERKEKKPEQQPQGKSGAVKKKQEKWSGRDSKQTFAHPWMLTSLKGHSGEVLDMDFSSNAKFLATCADDRSVVLWAVKHLDEKEHKNLRVNVEFDHGVRVRWSPDSKAFVIHKAVENVVEVYKVTKKPDGWIGQVTKGITFPKHHEQDIVGLDIAVNGRFIMTCSEKTDLVLWDLKGEKLAVLDTLAVETYCARVSPCATFVAASGFTPDVRVWEVVFTKTGDFDRVARAFDLKGHTSGIIDFAFSADSSRMATISKDNTWKVYDTKIEYRKGEDPHLLQTGKHEHTAGCKSHLAFSPNGEVIAIASGSDLSFYIVMSGKPHSTIRNVYSGLINAVLFDASNRFVLTAGDRHVRVFHNVPGYVATIATCEAKLKNQAGMSAATKERLNNLIEESRDFLMNINESDYI